MGLDQFACRTQRLVNRPVDFEPDGQDGTLYSWRKHPDLEGWMEKLYRAKGGEQEEFNCATVLLLKEDLDRLEEAVEQKTLPHTVGFFFGESLPEHAADDRNFIALARAAIADGWNVYYTSWW